MSVRLRMVRGGRKKRPFYRLVAADTARTRAGSYIERLGTFDPLVEPPALELEEDRIRYWLGVGATPSETVASLLKKAGVMDGEGGSAETAAEG